MSACEIRKKGRKWSYFSGFSPQLGAGYTSSTFHSSQLLSFTCSAGLLQPHSSLVSPVLHYSPKAPGFTGLEKCGCPMGFCSEHSPGRGGRRTEEKSTLKTLHPLNGKSTLWMRKEAGKEATPSSQATVSDGPAQVLLALCPMAGHLILINKCPCQLPSHRNACHSRAELARAKLRKGRRQPASIQPLSCTIQIINTPRSFLPSSLARREKSWERGEGEQSVLLRDGLGESVHSNTTRGFTSQNGMKEFTAYLCQLNTN